VETPFSLLLINLSQAALGGVLVAGVLRLGRTVAPHRPSVARVAGLICAVHPTLVYAATHVQVASLGTTLLVWTLALAHETGAAGRTQDAIGTGALLATLALTDPILAMSTFGIVCAIWQSASVRQDRVRRSLRLCGIIATTTAAGLMPWLVRNYSVHGEFVPIKSTFGYAFWQGNCALSEGTDKVVRPAVTRILRSDSGGSSLKDLNRRIWAARHEAGYLDDIALSKTDYRLLGAVSEPERSRILFQRALAELRTDPTRYVVLCLRRLRYFVLFDETNPKSKVLAYRVPHVALTILAALGLALAGPSLRRRLLPTILTASAIALFHTMTIVSARFHIPIEPLLALWASAGISRIADRWTSSIHEVGGSGAARYHVVGIGIERRLHVHRLLDGRGLARRLPRH
jgi:hypothetical protein